MRLVHIAKILGITGQELRRELLQVDFGVKPTDREVPDNLAMGVIRFVATRRKIEVDWDAVTALKDAPSTEATAPTQHEPAPSPGAESATSPAKPEQLHVLRKLSLEDVPKAAIAKQQQVIAAEKRARPLSRQELEERTTEKKIFQKIERRDRSSHQEQIKQKSGPVHIPAHISVKEFAEKAGVQVPKVIAALMKNGVLATINQQIDFETAGIIALDIGVQIEREASQVSVEALLKNDIASLTTEDDPSKLSPRPPIVTVMGHVDHGKTAILDAIRNANVVAGEAGGITQHIGAYQVEHAGKRVTFIDTPGHEAFTAMRARGAQITDVAILVVSAEEGVKPTTIEAINHAKDAGVPIIVAINKIDRPNADIERVKGELAGHGLQAESWGGDTPMIPCSAHTKEGIQALIDHVLLVSEMEELSANPSRPAIATVIESHLDRSQGPLATVIVNTGTLAVGDIVACGGVQGRVRSLSDALGRRTENAGPSTPVVVSGFEALPSLGDILQVFSSDKDAVAYLDAFRASRRQQQHRGFADLVSRLSEGKLKELKIILKADAQGSLESLQAALSKLATSHAHAKIIHAAIGAVTESDVMMASAGDALIIGFGIDTPASVLRTAERERVSIKHYDIIYKLLEEIELLLQGLVEPVEEEKIHGHLEVRGVFYTKGSEQIIGGKVSDGLLKRTPFRLLRSGSLMGTGRITSLKHVEKDIKEAKEGMECGLRVTSTVPVELGDVLECFTKEFVRVGA